MNTTSSATKVQLRFYSIIRLYTGIRDICYLVLSRVSEKMRKQPLTQGRAQCRTQYICTYIYIYHVEVKGWTFRS